MVPSPVAAFSRDSVRPGLIANCAPASVTSFSCSTLVTVPAPTIASGTSLAIARIASIAHSVRRVTSSTRTPPATSAFAIGTACSSFFTTITGTTGPEVRIASAVVFQFFIRFSLARSINRIVLKIDAGCALFCSGEFLTQRTEHFPAGSHARTAQVRNMRLTRGQLCVIDQQR